MRLLHYSAEPFKFEPSREYNDHNFKPDGLWVSVEGEDDWRKWCEGEDYNPQGLRYVSEIVLKPNANVLLIDTFDRLEEFDHQFSYADSRRLDPDRIEWSKVRKQYDGIIIAPYQWRYRTNLMWYCTWDCSSGVIWNLDAVAGVKGEIT